MPKLVSSNLGLVTSNSKLVKINHLLVFSFYILTTSYKFLLSSFYFLLTCACVLSVYNSRISLWVVGGLRHTAHIQLAEPVQKLAVLHTLIRTVLKNCVHFFRSIMTYSHLLKLRLYTVCTGLINNHYKLNERIIYETM